LAELLNSDRLRHLRNTGTPSRRPRRGGVVSRMLPLAPNLLKQMAATASGRVSRISEFATPQTLANSTVNDTGCLPTPLEVCGREFATLGVNTPVTAGRPLSVSRQIDPASIARRGMCARGADSTSNQAASCNAYMTRREAVHLITVIKCPRALRLAVLFCRGCFGQPCNP